MKMLIKTAVAGFIGLLALGTTAAFAGDGYGAKDRHYKDDRRGNVTLSVNFHNAHHGRYYDHRRSNRRVVYRDVFQTRYRARIVVTEEIVYRRKGKRLVCTVRARGPEADYVSKRRIHRIADRHCSPRARIRVFA